MNVGTTSARGGGAVGGEDALCRAPLLRPSTSAHRDRRTPGLPASSHPPRGARRKAQELLGRAVADAHVHGAHARVLDAGAHHLLLLAMGVQAVVVKVVRGSGGCGRAQQRSRKDAAGESGPARGKHENPLPPPPPPPPQRARAARSTQRPGAHVVHEAEVGAAGPRLGVRDVDAAPRAQQLRAAARRCADEEGRRGAVGGVLRARALADHGRGAAGRGGKG